jgi:DNA-binding transcriptional MerR regulator
MDRQSPAKLYVMGELLSRCPGMSKEEVYYLEQRGYLQPIKQKCGRVERNLYTREQVELVCAIWRHRQAGAPPAKAYHLARKEKSTGQLHLGLWPGE